MYKKAWITTTVAIICMFFFRPPGHFVLICEVLVMVYIVYFMTKEGSDMRRRGWGYWNDYWSWGEWSIILTALMAIGLRVYLMFLTQVSAIKA